MKKIKFFALAALLMGSTSVFAEEADPTPSDGNWKYEVTNAVTKTAKLISLVDSKKGTIEDLKIPAEVTGEGDVKYTVTAIADKAFQGDEKIKTVTFTTAIEEIGVDAFENASNITTVTFPEGSKLATIKNGAFANTFALEKIDLSNTKVYDLSAVTPFVKGTTPNVALEEIVLAAKTTKIGTALANLRALKKVNISATKIDAIEASAFAHDKNFTELVLPAVYKYSEETGEQNEEPEYTVLKENSLKDSYIQKLTINGKVKGGDANNGINATAATTLTEITFNGAVEAGAIKANAFAGNLKLANVSFNGNVAGAAILDGAFTDCATSTEEVTGAKSLAISIATGKATARVFAAVNFDGNAGLKAFAGEQVIVAKRNVAITAPDAAIIGGVELAEGKTIADYVPFRATFSASITPASQVKVYGTSTFYGKFMNTGETPVNIKREVATVYSAYVDGSKLYMDPLQVVDGNQIIKAGQAVIVKTTSPKEAADKSYNYIELAALPEEMPAAGHTMRVSTAEGNPVINDIKYKSFAADANPNYVLAAVVKDDEPTKVLYVVGDLTKGLKWQTPKDNVKLYNNTLYVFADEETASGRLEIIWLDGSEEEATAIKSVKSAKAENGAIYNLAGQKVNASYKGVVIKDGKKYIQK